MLRGAGLMSQASGLGPATARTTAGAPKTVRLCRPCNSRCPLRNPAFAAVQVHALSLSLRREASSWSFQSNEFSFECAEWQQCGLMSMRCCCTSQAPMEGLIEGDRQPVAVLQGRSYGHL